jgi:hypothetical protein
MKNLLALLGLMAILLISACGNNEATTGNDTQASTEPSNMEMNHSDEQASPGMDQGEMDMNHSGSGEVPQGLTEAAQPTYKPGDQVVIHANHMEGMNGAKATIVGAYNTVAYAVTYTPTTGGQPIPDHKWVIQQEIKDAGTQPLQPGATVTLEADHMKGMKGATATIDSAEQTTVYMIDYTPVNGGEPVTNHKWVVESEVSSS